MRDAKANILLVEDEENLHETLKLNLEMEGYSVTSAFDGSKAIRMIQEEYFDLINSCFQSCINLFVCGT